MDSSILEVLIRAGGFAVLAGVAIYSNVLIVKMFSAQIQQSHTREMEALKTLANDRKEILTQFSDLIQEVRSALQALQDEIYQLSKGPR